MYDLTTDLATLESHIPLVREGTVRVSVEFDRETLFDLTLLIFAENRGSIAVNHEGGIRTTYTL